MRVQIFDGLLRHFCARAHDDDNALGVRRADVIEQVILPPDDLGELVHRLLDDAGRGKIIGVDGFAALKVHVGVLRRAAHHRMIGRERASAVCAHEFVVNHDADIVFAQLLDLHQLVRGAKAVKEMQERHARFERGRVRDERQVHHFLHGAGA